MRFRTRYDGWIVAVFEALLSDLVKEHAPANETEVQEMAQSWWLMPRAIRIQNEAFTENRVAMPDR